MVQYTLAVSYFGNDMNIIITVKTNKGKRHRVIDETLDTYFKICNCHINIYYNLEPFVKYFR